MHRQGPGKDGRDLFALAGALVLAGCGGGDDAGSDSQARGNDTPAEQPTDPTNTITLLDNEYSPADPVIASGELQLTNQGESPHTFTVEDEDVDVEVEAGAEATEMIELAPGSYKLYCEFHRSQGMETTLTVV
jgi:plastocyanin